LRRPFAFGEPAMRARLVAAAAALLAVLAAGAAHAQADPLPSWNDGPAKARIVASSLALYTVE